jgi:hypothetical protein
VDSKSVFVGYPPGRISLRTHPRTVFPRSSLLSAVGRDTPKSTGHPREAGARFASVRLRAPGPLSPGRSPLAPGCSPPRPAPGALGRGPPHAAPRAARQSQALTLEALALALVPLRGNLSHQSHQLLLDLPVEGEVLVHLGILPKSRDRGSPRRITPPLVVSLRR